MLENLVQSEYPLLTYVLVAVVLGMLAFLFALYIGVIWFFGDACKKYFQARLRAFSDDTVAVMNIFDLNYNIYLSFAKQLIGGVFENTEKVGEKVIPKSVYSINGVPNIMVWDIHPRLHEDLITGLNILREMGCTTLEQLKEVAESDRADDVFFEVQPKSLLKKALKTEPSKYTYKGFYEILLKTKQKYEVDVTVDDVINFIEKSFDKNYRESIEARLINVQIKKKMDDRYTKYAFVIIGVIVLGLMIAFVYKKTHPAPVIPA